MALPQEYADFIAEYRKNMMAELPEARERLGAAQTGRGLFTSGIAMEGERGLEQNFLKQLADTTSRVGMAGAEAERGERTAREGRTWQSGEAARQRQFESDMFERKKKWQEELANKAREDANRQAVAKLVGGVALGALTGGLGAAGIFGGGFQSGIGASSAWGGAGLGALSGVQGITQMGMSGIGREQQIDLIRRLLGSGMPRFSQLTPQGEGLDLLGKLGGR